jgi:hypothetical protein
MKKSKRPINAERAFEAYSAQLKGWQEDVFRPLYYKHVRFEFVIPGLSSSYAIRMNKKYRKTRAARENVMEKNRVFIAKAEREGVTAKDWRTHLRTISSPMLVKMPNCRDAHRCARYLNERQANKIYDGGT